MAWAGLSCLQNASLILYSLLPVDKDAGHKLIPGLSDVGLAEHEARQVSAKIHANGKAIELGLDTVMLVVGLLCGVFASISMDSARRFYFINEGTVQYYTLTTFYTTFSHSSGCMDGKRNPADIVKCGLALVYLALFFLSLSFRTSYSAWKKVRKARQLALSEGYGGEEGGEALSPFLLSVSKRGEGSSRSSSIGGGPSSPKGGRNDYGRSSFLAHDTGVFSEEEEEEEGLALGPLRVPSHSPYGLGALNRGNDTPIVGPEVQGLKDDAFAPHEQGEEVYFESDSEIDAIMTSTQSEASFHGNRSEDEEADFV